MTAVRPTGILLAAGRGRRLGGTKQLIVLDTGDGAKPLVACAFDAIAPVCGTMIVVLGHEGDAVASALAPRAFVRVEADPDAPMIDSIKTGLRAAAKRAPGAPVLVQPADHADVDRSTLDGLRLAHAADPRRAVLPVHEGKGGHPVLVPARLVPRILDAPDQGGLRAFWEANPALVRRLPVDDPGAVRDLDVPEDLPGG